MCVENIRNVSQIPRAILIQIPSFLEKVAVFARKKPVALSMMFWGIVLSVLTVFEIVDDREPFATQLEIVAGFVIGLCLLYFWV